jgi:hypothetical protein
LCTEALEQKALCLRGAHAAFSPAVPATWVSARIRVVDRIAMTVFTGSVIAVIALGLCDVWHVPLPGPLSRLNERGLLGVVIALLLIMAAMLLWMLGSPSRHAIPTD